MPSDLLNPSTRNQTADELADDVDFRPHDNGPAEHTTFGLVELLLKNPERIDDLNRQSFWQRELFPRFLMIAQATYLVFAAVMLLLLHLAGVSLRDYWLPLPPASWSDGTALALPFAFAVGIVLAACVCLPSFYFYSLLAGVKMSWLQIVSLVGKGTAANAVLLLGILPVYVAAVLGLIVFDSPAADLQHMLFFGLLLPFFVGAWGLRSIYQGVLALSSDLPASWQCQRRCVLRRLTAAWAAVYAAVVPVMVYRLWGFFADVLQNAGVAT